MKKHTEKPPIDELFARKLGNMSMPPSADGFERLQARMNQKDEPPRLVVWRNPSVRPYMAAAACLAVVCLFGWLYWPNASTDVNRLNQVASTEKAVTAQSTGGATKQPGQNTSFVEEEAPVLAENTNGEVTSADKAIAAKATNDALANQLTIHQQSSGNSRMAKNGAEATLTAEAKPVENKVMPNQVPTLTTPSEPAPKEQLAESKPITKPTVTAERVLEVTIAEPQALVAARQEVKAIVDEKAQVAQTEKPEKEAKGNLWQQMKRLKQGEVFARQDDANNEDRGLLERAYSGLKHSLDKDKPTKQ